ncbi:hypothetical protein BDW22DRAFT_334588 [Trametopsis cervina]|nr:hypothetical protein BDW22DRAFT_334588 [Trametopsis cervina]
MDPSIAASLLPGSLAGSLWVLYHNCIGEQSYANRIHLVLRLFGGRYSCPLTNYGFLHPLWLHSPITGSDPDLMGFYLVPTLWVSVPYSEAVLKRVASTSSTSGLDSRAWNKEAPAVLRAISPGATERRSVLSRRTHAPRMLLVPGGVYAAKTRSIAGVCASTAMQTKPGGMHVRGP